VTVRPDEHYRPGDTDLPSGVYRVVGTGDPVALLRVADAEGRRVHAGDLRHVPDDRTDALEPAADPDAGFDPRRFVRGRASGLYWSVRRFLP